MTKPCGCGRRPRTKPGSAGQPPLARHIGRLRLRRKIPDHGVAGRTIDVWLPAKGKLQRACEKSCCGRACAGRERSADRRGFVGWVLSFWEIAATIRSNSRPPSRMRRARCDGAGWGHPCFCLARWRAAVWTPRSSSFAGRSWAASRERWFACNDARPVWRNEDGTLLVESRDRRAGTRTTVDDAHRTRLGPWSTKAS